MSSAVADVHIVVRQPKQIVSPESYVCYRNPLCTLNHYYYSEKKTNTVGFTALTR